MNNKRAYVYLVGAGPGDPGLITVKGIEKGVKEEVVVQFEVMSRQFGSRA